MSNCPVEDVSFARMMPSSAVHDTTTPSSTGPSLSDTNAYNLLLDIPSAVRQSASSGASRLTVSPESLPSALIFIRLPNSGYSTLSVMPMISRSVTV